MIEELVTIEAIDGDDAWVVAQRKTSCSACSAKSGCSTGVLSKYIGNRFSRIRVKNIESAKVGDQFLLAMEEKSLVVNALIVYGIPLFFLLIMGSLFEQFSSVNQYASVLGVFAGFVLGLVFAQYLVKKNVFSLQEPVLIRKVQYAELMSSS
ncbi:MAG: SoxR reducing system RseC family protein [Gammaproteobacteria bacterium]|nr:SoxR reducing system RseC family protein [Gammaproteobacteria bacterium]